MLQINEHIITLVKRTYYVVDNIPCVFNNQSWYILKYFKIWIKKIKY